jgi:LmbE family N-acetylglucosaminyl deacetylase
MRICLSTLISALLLIQIVKAQAPRSYTSSEILLQLKKLNTVGAVLYIAAHPDDENTRLIAYLANEKCLRTGYLSLTRGDGGQNLIGPEQGVELGVIRTQELLAARRIDGGEQFFTRAYDFGFSKSPEETLQKWNKDSLLSDMVWVIRNFRPDIIITRFATDGSGGHGHHTVSAILAEEAFDAAGDPTKFPEQLHYVDVWKPRRLFYNATNRFRDPNADMSAFIKLDVGGYNALLGKSYGEIAAESRSMHKSQGFGSAKQRGEYFEYFKPLKGDTAGLKDIFQGIDFSWKRVKGGEKIGKLVDEIIRKFDNENPADNIPQLEKAYAIIQHNLPNEYWYKRWDANSTLLNMAGVVIDLTSDASQCGISDTLKVNVTVINRSKKQVKLEEIVLTKNLLFWIEDSIGKVVPYNTSLSHKIQTSIPKDVGISIIHPLENPIRNNMFDIKNQYNIHLPNTRFTNTNIMVWLSVNKSYFYTEHPIKYKWVDPEKGELYRPVVITPPVMINVSEDVLVFDGDGKQRILKVIVKAGKDNVSGSLTYNSLDILNTKQTEATNNKVSLSKLSSFAISPLSQNFNLLKKGDETEIVFYINAPFDAQSATIKFSSEVDGQTYTKGIKEIKYDHIPIQTLFPEAEVKLVKLDVVKKSKRIGYIPGAGDEVQACLSQLGYEVTTLTDDKLVGENLNQYDAIITGVRAYNTNEKLPSFKQKLMDYVAAGGNLIVQYNTNSWAGPLNSDIGPYKFKITRNRITDEEAKVNFLLPNHPVFNTPNKITEKDFEGWIQERSIYHAGEWDSNYVALMSMTDPYEMTVGGVSPKGKHDSGALITAKYGKGNFIYTGLVFFRQLPAGVPGAYRLMVNLIELGK